MTFVRHQAATMLRARVLRDLGDSPAEIVRQLRHTGVDVNETTVRRWTEDDFNQRRMDDKAAAARRQRAVASGGRLAGRHTAEFQIVRIRALRSIGLSCAAIAKVMTFDFPDNPMTEHQVSYALRRGRVATFEAAA